MFEGLEDSGIMEMLAVANQQLEDWKDLTFGIHNGSLDIEGNFDRHIGSASDASSELGKIMLDFNKNEEEMMAGLAEMETAPWDRQISESPADWMEMPSLRTVATVATAVAAAVVSTAISVASFGSMAAPLAALCAAGISAAITMSTEATFAAMDLSGGYKDWDEVGTELAISAATSVISAVGGAAGAAIKGIGGIGGALLKTGVSMSTSATSTVATNAIKYAGDWDGFASSMSSFDTWSGVITSGAGSLVTNSLNLATIGDNGVKVTGFSSLNVNDMQSLNSVVGGLASSGLEYGLTGKTTLNVLNIADIGINSLVNRAIGNTNAPVNASCGLLELHLDDSQGASFALGTGGTDLSIGTVASAARGIDALKTNFKINHYTNKNNLQNAAIALRTQYGFGGKTENTQLKEILKGKTELKAGSGDGNAQTVRENGKRIVYLNGYSDNMTREEQLKLGITLGHEAYRDGIKGDEIAQKIETHEAVAGHTDMMTGMLADDMYKSMMSGIIAGDTNLQMDLLARSLGDEVFNDYVDGMYDSSADYWRMTNSGQLISDGYGWLKDMNGNYILDENGNKIGADKQESGLLNIMAGTGGQKYDSFTDEQKLQAQALMKKAGLYMDKNGQWNTASGAKLDMNQVMEISGNTISSAVFNAYYNNKVDYDLATAWQMDLRFGKNAMNKIVPEIAKERYSELITSHLKETGTPAALKDKYMWTIFGKEDVGTDLFRIDENNSYLDDLLGQHDFKGEKGSAAYTIDKWGCNFMSQLAVPQLLSGNIFSTDTILSIWNNSLSNGYVTGGIGELAGNVNSPEGLANFSFTHANISNYGMSVGHSPWWNKIPYTSITNIMNVGGHFVLGNLNNSIIYNPGYNGSLPYKYYNEVMLYEK